MLRTNPETQIKKVFRYTPPAFRMRVDLAPFTDVRVRKAINMAIDRETIVRTFYYGYATPKMTVVGPAMPDAYTPYGGYPPDVNEVLAYNPAKARQLLAEAGYPDGFKTIIDYNEPTMVPQGTTEILQFYLAAIGIKAELRSHDYSSFTALIYGKKHTGIAAHYIHNRSDALWSLDRFVTLANPYNTGAVNDPGLTKMYEDTLATLDPIEYARKVKEIDHYVVKQAYAIFWPHAQTMIMWQPWLKGYRGEGPLSYLGAGPLFARIWVDQDLKEQMTGIR